MLGIVKVECDKSVKGHLIFMEEFSRIPDPVKGWFASLGHPMHVVQFPRPVDAQTDQEIMVPEKFAPIIVQKGTVGLQIVLNGPSAHIFSFKGNNPFKIVKPAEGRLATLPGKDYLVMVLLLDILPDKFFQNGVSHPPVVGGGQEIFFVKIEAIGAVEIAHRPGRFCHHVKSQVTFRFHGFPLSFLSESGQVKPDTSNYQASLKRQESSILWIASLDLPIDPSRCLLPWYR